MIVFEKHFGNEIRIHDDVCPTLGEWLGTGGGNFPMIVDVLPFDTTQITSDKNWSHPRYGDPCHPLAAGQPPPCCDRGKG